jgi:hypothetical protein
VSLFNFFGNMVITVHAIDSLHLNLVVWSLLLAIGNTTLRGLQPQPCSRKKDRARSKQFENGR